MCRATTVASEVVIRNGMEIAKKTAADINGMESYRRRPAQRGGKHKFRYRRDMGKVCEEVEKAGLARVAKFD